MITCRLIALFCLGLSACRGAGMTGPEQLAYTAVAKIISESPTRLQLTGTIRNNGPESFTVHTGACSVGYRLYSHSASMAEGHLLTSSSLSSGPVF